MASAYDDSEQVINFYNSNEQQLNQIRNMVLEDEVVELLLEQAKVEDVRMTYEEVMQSLQSDTEAAT